VTEWLAARPLVLGGDVNVALTDSDIFHPDAFVGLTHVTQPERKALAAVLDRRGPSDLSTSCAFDGRGERHLTDTKALARLPASSPG
jgi:exodeoxyribonuclease-3